MTRNHPDRALAILRLTPPFDDILRLSGAAVAVQQSTASILAGDVGKYLRFAPWATSTSPIIAGTSWLLFQPASYALPIFIDYEINGIVHRDTVTYSLNGNTLSYRSFDEEAPSRLEEHPHYLIPGGRYAPTYEKLQANSYQRVNVLSRLPAMSQELSRFQVKETNLP